MAYPSVAGAYGLVPVKMVDGSPYNGAQRAYKIASGSTDVIFNGDLVTIDTDGTVIRADLDDAISFVGVFVGCSYTDATYGLTFRNHYPGGVTASDITAYVIDGANVLFKVAVVSGTDISYVTQAEVGNNAGMNEGTTDGNTVTGRSNGGLDTTSTADTNTLPLRIVQGVAETATSDGFTEVLVKFNAGHQMSSATGAGDA